MRLLVDTTVIRDYLRHKRKGEITPVVSHVEGYIQEHNALEFSVLTYYETARYLKKKGWVRHLAAFERMCRLSLIFPLDSATDEGPRSVWPAAIDLWVECKKRNARLGEADILIAATALIYERGIATSDEGFEDIADLVHVEDWRKPSATD